MTQKNYQSIHDNQIFIGSAYDVTAMLTNEKCDVIVDLRAELQDPDSPSSQVKYVHIPLDSKKTEQQDVIREAVDVIVEAYQQGKKACFH